MVAFRAPANRLTGFLIAGADQEFVPAEAWIENKTVIVRAAAVPEPVAVGYASENFTLANLYHRARRPAEPFRSDDFPLEGHLRPR
jgi:sialate O-acetylesterase